MPSTIDDERAETAWANYTVELLFQRRPEVGEAATLALAEAVLTLAGDTFTVSDRPIEELPSGLAPAGAPSCSKTTEIAGAAVDRGAPPRWLLLPAAALDEASPEHAQRLQDALTQSWWWPDAEAALARCNWTLRLLDDRLLGLDYRDRMRRLQQVLTACCEVLEPDALHWPASEQLLPPDAFVGSVRDDDFRSLLPGGVNVRFFRLEFEDTPDAQPQFLMDTRGLGALGLVDVQCHFQGLDPEDVSHVLYSVANYLFEKGRVIVPGNTVQGPGPRDAWLCRSGEALAPPRREILDLDPGFPFAAQTYDDVETADGLAT